MKKKLSSIFFTFLLIAFLSVSCKKESDDSITGKWDVTAHTYSVYQNNVKISEENYSYKTGEYVLVINADGTGKFLEDGADGVTFTWRLVSGNNYSIIEKVDPYTTVTIECEIVVNKNTLTWHSTGVSGTSSFVNHMVCNKL